MTQLIYRLSGRFTGPVTLLTAAVGHATLAALLAGDADGIRAGSIVHEWAIGAEVVGVWRVMPPRSAQHSEIANGGSILKDEAAVPPPLRSPLHPVGLAMTITVYQRTYPVKDAPVSLSFVPFASGQRCTFPVGDRVYEATYSEIRIAIPEDAKVNLLKNLLSWDGEKGRVNSTAKEVHALALARSKGFRLSG